mmetsp:Transcript_142486/g.248549  ORF Transcript_142486/g.248549 Transcript_142486/m.248549 type:complete len:345 (+) Transcript_142486:332-1366(+)
MTAVLSPVAATVGAAARGSEVGGRRGRARPGLGPGAGPLGNLLQDDGIAAVQPLAVVPQELVQAPAVDLQRAAAHGARGGGLLAVALPDPLRQAVGVEVVVLAKATPVAAHGRVRQHQRLLTDWAIIQVCGRHRRPLGRGVLWTRGGLAGLLLPAGGARVQIAVGPAAHYAVFARPMVRGHAAANAVVAALRRRLGPVRLQPMGQDQLHKVVLVDAPRVIHPILREAKRQLPNGPLLWVGDAAGGVGAQILQAVRQDEGHEVLLVDGAAVVDAGLCEAECQLPDGPLAGVRPHGLGGGGPGGGRCVQAGDGGRPPGVRDRSRCRGLDRSGRVRACPWGSAGRRL